jgi:hypothetical protein
MFVEIGAGMGFLGHPRRVVTLRPVTDGETPSF